MRSPNNNPDLTLELDISRVGDMRVRNCDIDQNASVHHSAIIGGTAEWVGRKTDMRVKIGECTIVRPYVTIDAGVNRCTEVGSDCLILTRVHIGHDTKLGNRVHVSPGAVICGCVTIGNDVKIGVNACIRQHVTIGDGATIGMGACVTKDVPAGETWVGNPAKPIQYGNDPMGVSE